MFWFGKKKRFLESLITEIKALTKEAKENRLDLDAINERMGEIRRKMESSDWKAALRKNLALADPLEDAITEMVLETQRVFLATKMAVIERTANDNRIN